MGVVNVTPDSFYSRSRSPDLHRAVQHALQLAEQGADLVDIGGESTRPGARPVSSQEEADRVLPVIEQVHKHAQVPVSVDTTKAAVAREAIAAGAAMVNDVSGLKADPEMAPVVAKAGLPVVVMHMRGTPRTMQDNPSYRDVLGEVAAELGESVALAREAGITDDHIWVDPGFGFGKRLEHNLELLRRLDELKQRLGLKLLVGTSRKSFIGEVLGQADPVQRLEGTLATTALALWLGADAVRVHDVEACCRVARMVDAVRGQKRPVRPAVG
jgi:dihydropteroate synthase